MRQHAHAPIVADLALGMRYFLDFYRRGRRLRSRRARKPWQSGAGRRHGEMAAARCSNQAAGARPANSCASSMPSHRLRARPPRGAGRGGGQSRAMGMALACFRAAGNTPARSGGRKGTVGWVDGEDVFLEPATRLRRGAGLARETGETLPVSHSGNAHGRTRALGGSRDASRQRYTVRRRLGGHDRQEVLHFRARYPSLRHRPNRPRRPRTAENLSKRGQRLGTVAGTVAPRRPRPSPRPSQKRRRSPAEMAAWGRSGTVRYRERPPGQENSIPRHATAGAI